MAAFNYWLPKKGLGHLVFSASALFGRLILLLFVACLKFRPRPASQIIQSLSLLGLIRFSARSNLSRRPKERLLLLWSTGTVLGGVAYWPESIKQGLACTGVSGSIKRIKRHKSNYLPGREPGRGAPDQIKASQNNPEAS